MKQQIGESISALMDQEGDELDLQRVLNGLSEGDEAAQAWRRYHLASAALRGDAEASMAPDLHLRIRDAIAGEKAPVAHSSAAARIKPLTGVMVAASVTAVILTGAGFYGMTGGDAGSAPRFVAATSGSSHVSPVGQPVGFGGGGRVANAAVAAQTAADAEHLFADDVARRALEAYMHSQTANAALNANAGLLPFARAASLEGRQ